MYTPGYIPAIDGQWDNVYSALAQFRKLESLYEEESAAEQAQDEAFYLPPKYSCTHFFAATVGRFRGYAVSAEAFVRYRLPTDV